MAKAKKQTQTVDEILEQALVPEKEQPYAVPENWVWTRVGHIIQVIMGQSPNGEATTDDSKYTGLIGGATDMGELYPKVSRYTTQPTKISKNNDVIISVRATLGKPIYSDGEYCLGRGVAALRSLILGNKFIRYFILSFEENIVEIATGTTFAQVSRNDIEQILLPLSPLPEQQRIVAVIESLFEKLDKAKDIVQSVLDSFENRKAAILHKAFTGELTAKWREENGVRLEDWRKKCLKECGQWYGGGTPDKSVNAYWNNGDVLWVTPKDMKYIYIANSEYKITEHALNNSNVKLIKDNAILLVVRSGILRRILPVAISTTPITVNQDMKVLIPNKINLKYIYWFIIYSESDIREKCSKSGTTVESISSDALYEYMVLLPTLSEQQEIVRILDNLLDFEQKAKDLCNIIEKIDLMKKAILARAFRGELGTNEPNEESAVNLLKECLQSREKSL